MWKLLIANPIQRIPLRHRSTTTSLNAIVCSIYNQHLLYRIYLVYIHNNFENGDHIVCYLSNRNLARCQNCHLPPA